MTEEEKPTVEFSDWEKLDLRVAEIEEVEDIAGADKLYKLTINIGTEKRTICAGIKQHYPKDDLKGKKIIVIANLAPRKMKGIESKGMLLAASDENHEKVILLTAKGEVSPGIEIEFKNG